MDQEHMFQVHAGATRALLAGQPAQAREVVEDAGGPLPVDLLRVAAGLLAGSRDCRQELRRVLDRIAGPGYQPLLSTLDAAGEVDWRPFLDAARAKDVGPDAVCGPELRLVGIDGAGQGLVLPIPEQADLVTVMFSCLSHCGDRIYIRLCGADGTGESLRLGAERQTLGGAGTSVPVSSRIPRLFQCRREAQGWALCLDGELLTRFDPGAAPELRLEVMPDREMPGDVEANFVVVELGAAPAAVMPDPDLRDFQVARVHAAWAEGRMQAVVSALQILAVSSAEQAAAAAAELLEACRSAGHAADWLLDKLLAYLPSEAGAAFRRDHAEVWGRLWVEARDLRVRFYRDAQRLFTWQRLRRRWTGKGEDDSFLALDGVSLDLYEGDILGIIGRNGAGKSTLLRTLAGMIPIEQGRVLLRGQHLLLSAGLGVRPELTGRENIFLGGYFMGLTHAEVATRFDEVVEFAELAHAIDQPFKFYSDGMKARLIFSMATSVTPEVLMLDELLSAGDLSFQHKAQARMDELIGKAGAVVVVTHGVDFVRDKCNKAIYLQAGRVRAAGSPELVVDRYLEDLHLGGSGASDPAALAGMLARSGDWSG